MLARNIPTTIRRLSLRDTVTITRDVVIWSREVRKRRLKAKESVPILTILNTYKTFSESEKRRPISIA